MKTCSFTALCPTPIGLGLAALLVLASAAQATTLNDEDLLLSRSPVIIRSRVTLGGEHAELVAGGQREKLKLAAAYGFGFNGHDRNFGLGLELPYLWSDPTVGDAGAGFGDFKVRVGQMFTGLPEGWRAGWFFETEFDTAATDVLAIANQRNQMSGGGGAVIPVTDRLAITTSLSYGWSLENGPTSGRKAEWEGHVIGTWKLQERTSLTLDYKAVLQTVNGLELRHTLEPGLGLTLGADRAYGVFSSLEIPLHDGGSRWVAKVGLTWFF